MRLLLGVLVLAAAGCAEAPPAPTPRPTPDQKPAAAAPEGAPRVVRGQLAIDPSLAQYRVRLPDELAVTGARYWAIVKMCVSTEGVPTSITLIKGAHPDLDPKIVEKLGNWRFKPYTLDGRAVPFCSNYRYEVSAR